MADPDNDRVVKAVELTAPIARVWNALTDHKAFGNWFGVDLDQTFEAGGTSTGRMTIPGAEGTPWIVYVDRMEPERLFTFRWYDTDDGTAGQDGDQPALLVTFQLEERDNATRLTITESGFAALPEPRRIELMRRSEEGWNIQADNIARYLSV